VLSATIVEASDFIFVRNTTLFYTNTMPSQQAFAVAGYAYDSSSGVDRVSFSEALGHAPTDVTTGFPYFQSSHYPIAPGETANATITATVFDRVDNQTTQTYSYALDSSPPAVTLDAPPYWADSDPIPITWQAEDAQSGVSRTRLYYRRLSIDPGWVDSGIEQSGTSGTFHFEPTLGITYAFGASAVDNLGNTSPLPPNGIQVVVEPAMVFIPMTLCNYPPQPVGTVTIAGGAQTIHARSVELTLDASVASGTVVEMRFSNDGANWSAWEPYATHRSWTLASGINGLRTVRAEFKGSLGGISDPIVDQAYLVLNGSFEQGASVPGWVVRENPLPLNVVTNVSERPRGSTPPPHGDYALLLGNPGYPCAADGVPLGYAGIEQTFHLPATAQRLRFRYVILSQDASTDDIYDRFEVYIQGTNMFFDGNMVSTGLGCENWWRVPGESNPRSSGQTSGWATATIDISAYTGQTVTIYFQNHSRLDGWYNTYTYIDDITIEGNW